MIIDTHSHIITNSYLDELSDRSEVPRIEDKGDGVYTIHCSDYLSYDFDERMYDLDRKLKDMEKAGIDKQIISIAMPGVNNLEPKKAVNLAKSVNNEIEQVVSDKPESFDGVATLPFIAVEEALNELDRVINDLNLKGISLSSNIGGRGLDDEDFWPIYQKVSDLGIPILIHPTVPIMGDKLTNYGLNTVVGFVFDSTVATLNMVFGGVFENFPDLKVVVPHAGGTIPYLIKRIDHQYDINPNCRQKISKKPSEYLKSIYVDTAQSTCDTSMSCVRSLIGAENIVFGSDYPFCSLVDSVNSVKEIGFSEEEKKNVFEETTKKIFNLEK